MGDPGHNLRHDAPLGGISDDLVHRLTESILGTPFTRHLGARRLPSPEAVSELMQLLRELMFPGFFGRRGLTEQNLAMHVRELASRIRADAEEQIRSVLRYLQDAGGASTRLTSEECDQHARAIADRFADHLPELRRLMALDVQAAFDGDPAAVHTDETVFCYPGIYAIFAHRVAHCLYKLNVPLLPRIIQEFAHTETGIDIHPGAVVGESFFIDHGGGVVIGETTAIGNHVRIYQGVTLGARSFPKDETGRLIRGHKRHPTIGDRVTIYAGAVILGGDTVIGDDCVISGSVFVTKSVPPGHIVRQKTPELVLRSHQDIAGQDETVGGG